MKRKIILTESQLVDIITTVMVRPKYRKFLLEDESITSTDSGSDETLSTDDINSGDVDTRLDDLETDVESLKTQIKDFLEPNVGDIEGSNEGRLGYIRLLTADILEYLTLLSQELDKKVGIPASKEKLNKLLVRKERKRYYLSTLRL
jgi:hypothetical protein